MREEWKMPPGHPNYLVSSLGRVKSNKRDRHRKFQFLKILPRNDGYDRVSLDLKDYGLHRLVLLTFVGPCPPGMQGAHLDGNPKNNALSNLKWTTQSENFQHKKIHGTEILGEKHHQAKLKDKDIPIIRQRKASGDRIKDIAADYSVGLNTIHRIINREYWRHVP